jgi:hypothetical protein
MNTKDINVIKERLIPISVRITCKLCRFNEDSAAAKRELTAEVDDFLPKRRISSHRLAN